MAITDIIVQIIALILLLMASIFSIISANNLTKVSSYSTDRKLQTAHNLLAWSAGIAMFGFLLVIVLMILSFVNKDNFSKGSGKLFAIAIASITIIIAIISGIMTAIAATNIRSSQSFGTAGSIGGSYNLAIISTLFTLVFFTILYAIYLLLLFLRKPPKQRATETLQYLRNLFNPSEEPKPKPLVNTPSPAPGGKRNFILRNH